MATVTITGNTIRGATTSKDTRTWQVRAVAYQYGGVGGGVVTTGADWENVYPVGGVLTFTAEAGAVVSIKTPDAVTYRVRIPTSDAGLWDVIEAGVAYQPDVAQDNLNLAVANAAPGFIAAELGQQTADAITTDLDAREIGFVDDGDGEGHFTIVSPDGETVAISGTLVPPAATWSGVAARPSHGADSVARDGTTDDKAALASDDDDALAADGIPLMLRAGVHRIATDLTVDSPVWFLPGAIIKPDSGVTVTFAGGIAAAPPSQIFDYSASGVVVIQRLNGFVTPMWWGATGDGTTDDTDPLQAWVEYLVANNATGWLPDGVYKTTDTVIVPPGNGWSIIGQSATGTFIRQFTDNTPVLQIGDTSGFSSHYQMANFTLDYNAAQPSTNTSAFCIKFSGNATSGTFFSRFSNIRFNKCYYAMMCIPSIFAPWGSEFDALQIGTEVSGGFLTQTGCLGAPSNRWGRITLFCNNAAGPIFNNWADTSASVSTLEFLEAQQGAKLIYTSSAYFSADFGTVKLENGDYTSGGVLIDFVGKHHVRFGDLRIFGNNLTIGTGTTFLRPGYGTTDSRSLCTVNTLRLECTGGTSSLTGNAYALNVPSGAGRAIVGSVHLADGWQLCDNGATATGEQLTIQNMVTGHVKNAGDADYTIPSGVKPSPNIIMFKTALTANRTVTLPDNYGNEVFGGLYYEIVIGANVLASYSLTIAVTGRSDLRVIPAGTTAALKFRYVHRQIEWVLTDVVGLGTPQTGYAPTNVTPDRAFDADTVAVAELADVVGTLINDLKAKGIIAS